MPDGRASVTFRIADSIAEIPASEWDSCAGDDDPFVRHAFLAALEQSHSACARTGWAPRHILIDDAAGRLVACAPLYLKSHSYGEYVFDWSWADAYTRAGGQYYPKLQCAVPFTPATGPRLLVRPGQPQHSAQALLLTAMVEWARRTGVSSLHVTFPTEAQWRQCGEAGLLLRQDIQYHWTNRGYRDFADFLDALSSRKRKDIRKERAKVAALDIRTLTGAEITPAHWDAFYGFYLATVDKKCANAYLRRDFFHRVAATMAENVVLILAFDHGAPVAGALNLLGRDTLYGRNWGCVGAYRFLHFELCYYRALDFAIARGLARVEAGAQGEHKISRGYLPTATYSAHWIADSGFRRVLSTVLTHERASVTAQMAELMGDSPYRSEGGG